MFDIFLIIDPAITATLVGVAFAALVSALGFILRGMRSDIRELGSKVDTILFALVHAGLLSPQQAPGAPLTPRSTTARQASQPKGADDTPPAPPSQAGPASQPI